MTAPDPKARTNRKPITIDGVTFGSYRTGINAYTMMTEDGLACVWHNRGRRPNDAGNTYSASYNSVLLGRLYRSEQSALRAAAKKVKEPAP